MVFDLGWWNGGRFTGYDDAMQEARLLGITIVNNDWGPLVAELKRRGLMCTSQGRICENSRGKA